MLFVVFSVLSVLSLLLCLSSWFAGVLLGDGVVDRCGVLCLSVVSSSWCVLSLLSCLPQFGSKAGLKTSWGLRASGHVSGFAWFARVLL